MSTHRMACIVSVAVLSFLAHLCQGISLPNKNKVIIDTDSGGDDAIAILAALLVSEKIKVMAITCTYGNTWLENVQINVLKTLTVANRSYIPVYSGADKPLVRNLTVDNYFGKDGLSDFKFDKPINGYIDRSKHAATAMIDIVKQYPGAVNIVTLGPLTNVALAMSIDPTFSRNVKRFYVMGSIPNPKNSLGFNFNLDPESTAIFLNSSTPKTKLIVSNIVASNYVIEKNWRMNVLGRSNSEIMKFANNAESAMLNKYRKNANDSWRYPDLFTMAVFLWPELVTDSTVEHVLLDTDSANTGALKYVNDGDCNVEVIRRFDREGLKMKLLQYFK